MVVSASTKSKGGGRILKRETKEPYTQGGLMKGEAAPNFQMFLTFSRR